MFTNTAYISAQDEIVDFSKPLRVTSCGIYQVFSGTTVVTERPNGRADYQLLYVSSGKATFIFDKSEQVIEEGSIIIFKPHQAQYYYYNPKDKPIIYWIHFSGKDVDSILKHYNLLSEQNIFYIGVCNNLPMVFNQIIDELKLREEKHEEMAVFKFNELLLYTNRALKNISMKTQDTMTLINNSKTYFDKNFNQNININNYANSNNISACWLIKKFKEVTGTSPMQYIINIRLNTAKNLLLYSKHNISEIATTVGFSNPLYFSRLFTKHFGISPSQFKKEQPPKL